jgi:tetratricopeptide (TPR) repeat protein
MTTERKPTVFISYSHDSKEHAARVLALADRLVEDGLDCILDQYESDPSEGWPRWMDRKIREADLVIMICTETYFNRVMGKEQSDVGWGFKWEGNLIYQHIYQKESENIKFIPVLFADGKVEHIPTPLQGKPFYRIDSETGYDQLYWRLTEQYKVEKPKPGQIRKCPELKRVPLFEDVPQTSSFAPIKVSLESLPVTNPELFGRDEELKQLDAVWEDPKTHIIALVAWGGVGKTALVNRWLLDMEQDRFRGAERVFGWSFYSQGAAEGKQASADRFLADALRWFGDPTPDEGDPMDKGKRLARLIKGQRTLLVLDGVEPLQYPPGAMEGRLKDQGLSVVLKDLAMQNPGLCVITTRLKVDDLQHCFGRMVNNLELAHLSPDAGERLLRNLGVEGTEKEFRQAVQESDGHALALNLLGTYLVTVCERDVRRRNEIKRLVYEEGKQGQHARWVMESYEQWLKTTEKGRRELNILRIMGLFDRPAEMAAIEALLEEPEIEGLTDELLDWLHLPDGVHLNSSPEWKFAVQDLRELRLLAGKEPHSNLPVGTSSPRLVGEGPGERLDCHPLVCEHFGGKLQRKNPNAWKEAHSRLYEYYKNLPEKEYPDTLEEMEPLFAAVAHGCLAGKYQEVVEKVYYSRIQRDGQTNYCCTRLGAFGADLAAVANFFEELWNRPAAGLSEFAKAAVLNWAGFRLRAVGRLREAAQPMLAGMEACVEQENWRSAAINAGNLSELWLKLGEVTRAVESARQRVDFADRSGDDFQKTNSRTTLADALHQAGNIQEAEDLFREAERMQQEWQPEYPLLYSLQGFRFCDLLLSLGQYQEVIQRIEKLNEWHLSSDSLLDIALEDLVAGRAFLAEAQTAERPTPDPTSTSVFSPELDKGSEQASQVGNVGERARQYLYQAVAGLRESGNQDDLPRGLLARAVFYRFTGEFDNAWDDLHEAQEIAERGEMRLWLVDYHLEAARLIRDSGSLPDDAQAHLAEAKQLIAETGYHRRDAELEELMSNI